MVVNDIYLFTLRNIVYDREQEKDKRRLFNWSEWVRYINCRSSVVSVYHQATRDKYHPTSAVGGSKPFLSHWEKLPSKHTFKRRHGACIIYIYILLC